MLLGDPWGPSVVLNHSVCLRGLDLHLSLLGFGLIHLPPAGPLEEATLRVVEEDSAWEGGVSERLDQWLNMDTILLSDEWVSSYHITQKR